MNVHTNSWLSLNTERQLLHWNTQAVGAGERDDGTVVRQTKGRRRQPAAARRQAPPAAAHLLIPGISHRRPVAPRIAARHAPVAGKDVLVTDMAGEGLQVACGAAQLLLQPCQAGRAPA